ncbi:MAG TPA: hypothetical protein VLM88_01435, partial [Proteiniclasticum sp.]|nr:hypothetical protein [Proteiniclasticum sp.]
SLYRESYDLDKLLSDTFNQMIHYGQDDIFVMLTIIKAHRHILEKSNEKNKEIVFKHVAYLKEILDKKSYASLDRGLIEQELDELDLHFKKAKLTP